MYKVLLSDIVDNLDLLDDFKKVVGWKKTIFYPTFLGSNLSTFYMNSGEYSSTIVLLIYQKRKMLNP